MYRPCQTLLTGIRHVLIMVILEVLGLANEGLTFPPRLYGIPGTRNYSVPLYTPLSSQSS